MNEAIMELKKLVNGSDNIVFFGGAGVSTESGIKDFRSVDGLYRQKFKYPPETMLSHTFFETHTEEFYDFYRSKMLALDAQPNAAHRKLAQWEREGKLKAVITQNIDGLHQKAGSREVLELHGSVLRNYCRRCGKFYGVEAVAASAGIPRCACGGIIKPDVVLYEESLDEGVMEKALQYIANADMLIIGGTSLVVYPAAGLVRYYRGSKLVVINRDATGIDADAALCISAPIGEVLGQLYHGSPPAASPAGLAAGKQKKMTPPGVIFFANFAVHYKSVVSDLFTINDEHTIISVLGILLFTFSFFFLRPPHIPFLQIAILFLSFSA